MVYLRRRDGRTPPIVIFAESSRRPGNPPTPPPVLCAGQVGVKRTAVALVLAESLAEARDAAELIANPAGVFEQSARASDVWNWITASIHGASAQDWLPQLA
jgi:hypothetical protein